MRRPTKRQFLCIYSLPSAVAIRKNIGEECLTGGASARFDHYAIDDAYVPVNPYMYVLEILPRHGSRRGVLPHEVELVSLCDDSVRHNVQKVRGQNRFERVRIAFGCQPMLFQINQLLLGPFETAVAMSLADHYLGSENGHEQ